MIDGGVRGRRRERRKGKGDGEGRRREEVEERRGMRKTWKSGRRRDRTVRRDREFSRRCQSSLSLCVGRGRRRTSDGPPTVPDPIFFVRLSVYPLGSNSSRAWGIPRRPDVPINNAYNV